MSRADGPDEPAPWVAPGAPAGPGRGAVPPPPPSPPSAWPPGPGGAPPAPWLPAPMPPARRPRPWLILLLVAGALAAVAAVVFLVVGAVDDSGPTEDRFAEADPADAATVTVPDDFEVARARGVRVSVPPTWVWAALGGDAGGVGDTLSPGDPAVARELDERLSTLPRSALLVAFDEDDLHTRGFRTNIVLVRLPSMPDGDGMRTAVAAEMEALGADVESVSYLDSSEGRALRVRYSMRQQGVPVSSLQYWYAVGGDHYTLSFSSDAIEGYVAAVDAMASSFDVTA